MVGGGPYTSRDRCSRQCPLGLERRARCQSTRDRRGSLTCGVRSSTSRRGRSAGPGAGGGAGAAASPPRGGAGASGPRGSRARPSARQSARSSGRRHVVRGQCERAAAPGGAAQAGGQRGEDQGLSGGCRAPTVLHAKCLQGCPAGGCSSWEQPLPGAQILCFTLKTGKKFAEECFQAQSDE